MDIFSDGVLSGTSHFLDSLPVAWQLLLLCLMNPKWGHDVHGHWRVFFIWFYVQELESSLISTGLHITRWYTADSLNLHPSSSLALCCNSVTGVYWSLSPAHRAGNTPQSQSPGVILSTVTLDMQVGLWEETGKKTYCMQMWVEHANSIKHKKATMLTTGLSSFPPPAYLLPSIIWCVFTISVDNSAYLHDLSLNFRCPVVRCKRQRYIGKKQLVSCTHYRGLM